MGTSQDMDFGRSGPAADDEGRERWTGPSCPFRAGPLVLTWHLYCGWFILLRMTRDSSAERAMPLWFKKIVRMRRCI